MQEADPNTIELRTLNRLLDQTKATVFLHSGTAAFLGSIMCALNFFWSRDLPSAATDGVDLWWNPDWFMSLDKKPREVVLRHELWHVARMHMLRRGSRDPEVWNWACDYVINNDLKAEKCDFSFGGLVDDQYIGKAEEEVYDIIMAQPRVPNLGAWGNGTGIDMLPVDPKKKQQVVNTVVTAVHQAKMTGGGTVPGAVLEIVEQFLTPVVPWQSVLARWFSEKLDEDYSWARPNRRFNDMYLPSRRDEMGRLENLRWYIDVSGSIRQSHIVRFRSELKFVKEQFCPEKLSVVQFDTKIQRVDTWEEDDPFDKIEIKGRGGTSLECVRRDMLEERPTAAIIFSDMECSRMDQTGIEGIPILWVMLPSRSGHTPSFGDIITMQE